MAKIRVDDLLVEQGYFADRDAALRAVIAREVRVDDVYVSSAASKIPRNSFPVVGISFRARLITFDRMLRVFVALMLGLLRAGFRIACFRRGLPVWHA